VIHSTPMAHPLEATIRGAYAVFNRGDIDGYLKACVEDFAFHVPGRSGIAGTYVGRQGLYDLGGKAMEEDVEDVLANDHHAVGRLCLNQHQWLAIRMREEKIDFSGALN
jgi:hypothetical protein